MLSDHDWLINQRGVATGREFVLLVTALMATVAAWLWLLVTLVFTWYVRNIGSYNVLYGSIGAVIALMR